MRQLVNLTLSYCTRYNKQPQKFGANGTETLRRVKYGKDQKRLEEDKAG